MNTNLVLTVIGDDRPGLVESLSRVIAAHDGSWLESRMARLAGKFAGILRATVPTLQLDAAVQALNRLDADGLRVVIESVVDPGGVEETRRWKLELVGDDHPGIVRDIARALAQHGINVVELHTELASAPMTGDVLFKATALLAAPLSLSLEDLSEQLEALAADLVVDLSLVDVAGGLA